MRTGRNAGFTLVATAMLAGAAQPSAAMVIYPWCANYAGRAGTGGGSNWPAPGLIDIQLG
jgi:hypothetical protein